MGKTKIPTACQKCTVQKALPGTQSIRVVKPLTHTFNPESFDCIFTHGLLRWQKSFCLCGRTRTSRGRSTWTGMKDWKWARTWKIDVHCWHFCASVAAHLLRIIQNFRLKFPVSSKLFLQDSMNPDVKKEFCFVWFWTNRRYDTKFTFAPFDSRQTNN